MKGVIILVFIFLMACSAQQYVCQDGSVVEDHSLCLVEEPSVEVAEPVVPEVEPETPEVVEEIEKVEPEYTVDKVVSEMIVSANKRSKSFSYIYTGPPTNKPQDTYYYYEGIIKVEPMKASDHKLSQPYTHVYLNDKTLVTCESLSDSRCPNGLEAIEGEDVSVYDRMTPLDWVNAIVGANYVEEGPTFENRETEKIWFTTGELSGHMHLVKFYLIPGKILFDNGDEIEFRELSFNTVDIEHVTPPEELYPTR